ncbi:GerMN domain-containing protein [Bacillus sp. D386]|uniref:GerMN domain-containing protein n=1 Tax=Bacillus sp. D386 TaxID=2587155 RepID=UPI001120202B|nr:GerMN domain-containing protein [Bacillus sp. D386]
MPLRTKSTLVASVLISSVLVSGCGLFDLPKKEEIDPPQDVTYLKEQAEGEEEVVNQEGVNTNEEVGKNEEALKVQTELYLMDANGYIVPQTIPLPNTESVAKQAVEYLVTNGPVSQMLPNGFKAVLPSDTAVKSVDIKDGVATVDFSKEFKEYKKEDETKILESVTWTLTQFDKVEKVKLQIEGQALKEMPVNKTAIQNGTSRLMGINNDHTDTTDIMNTRPVTVYYMSGETDNYYYVPVTKRISNQENDHVEAVVSSLIKGPGYSSPLVTEFRPDVALVEEPKIEDGVVTLNFNESIYSSFDGEEKIVSGHLLNELVLSLTEQKDIKKVAIQVNGEGELLKEDGKKLSEPVTRPETVNTGKY